jgi:hypothetical protein
LHRIAAAVVLLAPGGRVTMGSGGSVFVEQRLPLQGIGLPLMCGFFGHRQPFLPVWVVLVEVDAFH